MTTATEPTDAEILDLWESFVGDPTEEFPLSNSDKLCFAREASDQRHWRTVQPWPPMEKTP